MNQPPRKRRRAVRVSDAPNYDRTADAPEFQSAFNNDGERRVALDPDADDAPASAREFYAEERPPHY